MRAYIPIHRLLPQNEQHLLSSQTQAIKYLNLYKKILHELKEYLNHCYLSKSAVHFDPHVGDNLCQIRACVVAYVFERLTLIEETYSEYLVLLEKIETVCEKIDVVISLYRNERRRYKAVRIIALLDEFQINLQVSRFVYWVFLYGFLSKYKVPDADYSLVIDYNKLRCALNITKTQSRRMIHIYQLAVSRHSCAIMLNMNRQYKLIDSSILLQSICFDADKRSILPCYLVMRLLLQLIKDQRLSILLVSRYYHEDNARYCKLAYDFDKSNYVLEESLSNDIAIVFHGECYQQILPETQYIQSMVATSIETIILANMATHPQYPKTITHSKEIYQNDLLAEYQHHKSLGESLGMCKTQKRLFYTKHIYCAGYDEVFDGFHIDSTDHIAMMVY